MGDEIESDVHPNKKGNKLLEFLLLRHLRYNPISYDKDNRGWFNEIRTYDMKRYFEDSKDEVQLCGNVITDENGIILDSARLKTQFEGNRIDLFYQIKYKAISPI